VLVCVCVVREEGGRGGVRTYGVLFEGLEEAIPFKFPTFCTVQEVWLNRLGGIV